MYPTEILNMSVRCNHTPEYLIKEAMRNNVFNIFNFFFIELVFILLFVFGLNIVNSSSSILADIIGVWMLISGSVLFIILIILSRETILRILRDNREFSIECLINEEREFRYNK